MNARKPKPCPLCRGAYYQGRAEAFEEIMQDHLKNAQLKKTMVCKNCRHWVKSRCKKTGTAVCGSDRCNKWELKGGKRWRCRKRES